MRIQFYSSDELQKKLEQDSSRLGVDVQVLVNDILNKHYGLVPADTMSDAEIERKVLQEITEYIQDENNVDEFDLNMASPTYSRIEMIYAGKPRILKARLGRVFAKHVASDNEFKYVEQVMLKNGNPKRSIGNRAALYRVDWKRYKEDKYVFK